MALRPLALTMGDPAGIGPELALAAWRLRDEAQLAPFLLFADAAHLARPADTQRQPSQVFDEHEAQH